MVALEHPQAVGTGGAPRAYAPLAPLTARSSPDPAAVYLARLAAGVGGRSRRT